MRRASGPTEGTERTPSRRNSKLWAHAQRKSQQGEDSQHQLEGISNPPPRAIAPFDKSQARRHQHAWADHRSLPVEHANSIGMKMVLIPPGEFLMGSPEDETDRSDDEGLQHRVRITNPFYLGQCEVTQQQYETVMGSNPSFFKTIDRPVERASWEEAVEFCRKLSVREGRTYRSPRRILAWPRAHELLRQAVCDPRRCRL